MKWDVKHTTQFPLSNQIKIRSKIIPSLKLKFCYITLYRVNRLVVGWAENALTNERMYIIFESRMTYILNNYSRAALYALCSRAENKSSIRLF